MQMWQKLRIRYMDYEEVALQTCSLTEMEFLILYPCSSWSQVNLARGELNKPDNDFQLSGRPGTTLILPTQNSLVCLRRTKGPSVGGGSRTTCGASRTSATASLQQMGFSLLKAPGTHR